MVSQVSAQLVLAAKTGPELPSIDDFLPDPILFQGTPFAINRIILIRIVATIVLLLVMYQPVYHRDTGRFDSAEALIRLSDDQDQPISPAEFIPVAGENGLIDALS